MTGTNTLALLATALGRRDQEPNVNLAQSIGQRGDQEAVGELVAALDHGPAAVRGDAIKVLYEIGESNPELIADRAGEFLALLDHRNNRLVWGAMAALDAIAPLRPGFCHAHLDKILGTADAGSVITRDHAINILIELAKADTWRDDLLPMLAAQLAHAPPGQLPMYGERSLAVVSATHADDFIAVLTERLRGITKPSQRRRIERSIDRLRQLKEKPQ